MKVDPNLNDGSYINFVGMLLVERILLRVGPDVSGPVGPDVSDLPRN